MVKDMLDQGVIHNSQYPWASPIVLVVKHNGTASFCVDYHKLNAVTKMDAFPLPRIKSYFHILFNIGSMSILTSENGSRIN